MLELYKKFFISNGITPDKMPNHKPPFSFILPGLLQTADTSRVIIKRVDGCIFYIMYAGDNFVFVAEKLGYFCSVNAAVTPTEIENIRYMDIREDLPDIITSYIKTLGCRELYKCAHVYTDEYMDKIIMQRVITEVINSRITLATYNCFLTEKNKKMIVKIETFDKNGLFLFNTLYQLNRASILVIDFNSISSKNFTAFNGKVYKDNWIDVTDAIIFDKINAKKVNPIYFSGVFRRVISLFETQLPDIYASLDSFLKNIILSDDTDAMCDVFKILTSLICYIQIRDNFHRDALMMTTIVNKIRNDFRDYIERGEIRDEYIAGDIRNAFAAIQEQTKVDDYNTIILDRVKYPMTIHDIIDDLAVFQSIVEHAPRRTTKFGDLSRINLNVLE